MSEMVERVARAMLAADYPNDVGGEMENLWWDRHGHTYLRYARASIEAMRSPTKEMIISGNDAAEDKMEMDGYESQGYWPIANPGLAHATINAMIDAALNEKPRT